MLDNAYSLLQRALPGIFVGAGILLVLLMALWVGSLVIENTDHPTFNFIGLVIIFMAALTLAAAVFVGLNLGNPNEAFGLPTGSMRALLAIGIMILFVVFGLPMVSPQGSTLLAPKEIRVSPAQLETAIRTYREEGLRVRVLDFGSPATPGTAAIPPTATTPGTNSIPPRAEVAARIEVFGRLDPRSAEEIDFGKQVLTAVITLLTSVVSFYFGSRAVTEGSGRTGLPGGPGGDPAADRRRIGGAWAPLAKRIAAAGARVDKIAQDPATADNAERKQALAGLGPLRTAVEQRVKDVDSRLAAADSALALLAAATDPADIAQHMAKVRQELIAAEALVAGAEADLAAYEKKVGDLEKL